MMCCKSLATLFLMLTTASSQGFQDLGGLPVPFSDVPPSESSTPNTALDQSQNENYGLANPASTDFASKPYPYGLQQADGQPNIFNNYGLQNQGLQHGLLDQATDNSGFQQSNPLAPEWEIIAPPSLISGISKPEATPQIGAFPALQLNGAPGNFPLFPSTFPQDSSVPTWKATSNSENSPEIGPAVPSSFEWVSKNSPGNIPGFTISPDNYGNQPPSIFTNQPEQPIPLAEPPLPPLPVELPDIPAEPYLFPVGNLPGDGSESTLDSPYSELPTAPLVADGIPAPVSDNVEDSFENNVGLGSDNNADSSSVEKFPKNNDATHWNEDDDFGGGYNIVSEDGDYYYYYDHYDDDYLYEECVDDDDYFYDDDDDEYQVGDDRSVADYNYPHGFGAGIKPWPIANFFPGPNRCCCCCCCVDCCEKTSSKDFASGCDCRNSRKFYPHNQCDSDCPRNPCDSDCPHNPCDSDCPHNPCDSDCPHNPCDSDCPVQCCCCCRCCRDRC